jgi:hypothetical protein
LVVCGLRSFFFMHPARYSVRLMAEFKSGYHGRSIIAGSRIGWST